MGIDGYIGLYTISRLGIVLNRFDYTLCQCLDEDGYLYVKLYKNGKGTKKRIHRLVAETFIPNPDNKPTVNHIDGDKLNNHYLNLEWATRSEQIKHAIKTGLFSPVNPNPPKRSSQTGFA